MFGISDKQAQDFTLDKVTANGNSAVYSYTETIYGYELDFKEDEPDAGVFQYIGQRLEDRCTLLGSPNTFVMVLPSTAR